ncbi:MAG: polysaccharide biosynthesis C-terminal domain-containing protein [Planctomycetaceae bacterium]|nr:polysaccharide biosynthesis C-terminal domain-containing protein [Planctomycetaceae bacterium]
MSRIAHLLQQVSERLSENPLLSRLLGGASIALATQVGGHVLKLLSFVCLARWTTNEEDVGIYASAWSMILILSTVSAVGLKTTTLRFLPQYLEQQDWPLMRGFLRRGYLYMTVAGLMLAITGSLVLPWLDRIPQFELSPETVKAYLIAVWIVPFWSLCEVRSSIIRSTENILQAFGPLNLLQPLVLIVGSGILVLLMNHLDANQILFVLAVSVGLILLIQEYSIRTLFPAEIRNVTPEYDVTDWWKVGVPLFWISLFIIIIGNADVVLLNMLGQDQESSLGIAVGATELNKETESGIYAAATRTARLSAFLLITVNAIVAPLISQAYARREQETLSRICRYAITLAFWPSFVLALILVLFGGPILELFRPGFSAGYWPMVIIAVGQLINALTGPVGLLLSLCGHQRASLRVYGGTTVLFLVLNMLLIPQAGMYGAALANGITIVITNLWLAGLVYREMKIIPLPHLRFSLKKPV